LEQVAQVAQLRAQQARLEITAYLILQLLLVAAVAQVTLAIHQVQAVQAAEHHGKLAELQ
jgi:hypothetical protein